MGVLETALYALQMLDQCDTPSALVGGLAVSVRTEPRNTRDVDFAVGTLDDDHAESIVRALTGADYRIVAVLEQEATGRLATVRLRRTGDPALVNLLFASSGIEPDIVRDAEPLDIGSSIGRDLGEALRQALLTWR